MRKFEGRTHISLLLAYPYTPSTPTGVPNKRLSIAVDFENVCREY